MSDVIKVNHLERDEIKRIYTFTGKRDVAREYPWRLSDGTAIFTDEELKTIKARSIEVVPVEGYIHGDDTIATIKKKIIKYTKLRISSKELYLFGIKTEQINPSILYNQLTQNDTYKLDGNRLCQFLLNIVPGSCDKTNATCPIEEKSTDLYDFEDMMTLDGIEWNGPISYTIPIGQKLSLKKKYPFIANPYNCVIMDEIIRKKTSTMVSTQNSNLLFEYKNLCSNNIFICLAEEVIEYSDSLPDISQPEIINLYFPTLALKNKILSLDQLKLQKIALYDEERRLIDKKFNMYNDRIDLLYDIFYMKKTELDYIDNTPGILKTEFVIHPRYPMKMPLEMLFKLINSTSEIPLVKYNPGRDRENIYRLFTANNIATNGKKIPYLYTINSNKKGKIIRLSKIMARKKRVAYYIEYRYEDIDFAIDCEFEINGNINITVQHSGIIKRDILQTVIRNALNGPILTKVQQFLEQSGYTFQIFDSFNQDNIEFKDITFIAMLPVKKKIKLKPFASCLSSVFTILDDKLDSHDDELRLKYKRVSNYNELDSIDSFINEMRRNDEDDPIIIRKLMQNFNLEEGEAVARYGAWASQINVETDLFENKSITIRTNTGFPITLTRNSTNFITTVKIANINDIGYLQFINIYIDSLLRLITDKKSTEISSSSITSLCKGKTVVEAAPETDIVTHKIRFAQDQEKASNFLELFQESGDGDVIDFENVEFGDMGESPSGKSESKEGVEVDFEGVEFGSFGDDPAESIGKDEGEEFDFGDLNFEDLTTGIESVEKAAPAPLVRQLSEVGELPEQAKETKGADVSPHSDSSSEAEVNLKGVQLKGTNNIFMKKKENLQPSLFLKKDKGRYKAYSKSCPSQYAKQPIILTEKEKEYIDSKDGSFGTKSYDEHITYGTGDTKYHYICPRFWCLADDNGKQRSLSLEEINKGACGGWDALVPDGSATVPDGKRIVEFTDTRFHKSKTKTKNLLVYKPMFPSFMDKSKHETGLCIPCCFTRPTRFNPLNSNWILRQNAKGKDEYYNTETKKTTSKYPVINYDDMYKPEGKGPGGAGPSYNLDENGNIVMDSIKGVKEIRDAPANARKIVDEQCNQTVGKTKQTVKAKSIKIDDDPLLEAWPLNPGQIGYIPIAVQKFLGYSCREICQTTLSDHSLKTNQPCLLHKGVEKSDKQSFLACIADIYNDASDPTFNTGQPVHLTNKPPVTIRELKDIMVRLLTIDSFITLQNGDLVTIFSDDEEIDIEPYKTSLLYKSLQPSDGSLTYFTQVVSAFTNFIEYLQDDNITIDYTYLWDFISQARSIEGSGLFENGLNLIILKSPDDDITTKIELICPTNHYSSSVYNINKKTLILYTRGDFFEPIYKYTKVKKHLYSIDKLFDMKNIIRELPEVGDVIKHIWTDLSTKCKPLPSMPDEYDFVDNIDLITTLSILTDSPSIYEFQTQIASYSTKVIGVLLQKKSDNTDKIYLPCSPSAINPLLPLTFINESIAWKTYKKTFESLAYLERISKGELKCQPRMKLVNDSVVIGIITATNQLVPTIPEAYQAPADGIEPDGITAVIRKISPESFNYLDLDSNLLTNKSVDEERIKKVRDIRLESHFYNVFRNMLRVVLSYYENKDTKNRILDAILNPTIPYYEKLQTIEAEIKRIMADYVTFSEFDDRALGNMGKIELCLNISSDNCNKKGYCTFAPSGDNGTCKLIIPKTNLISGGDNSIQYFARIANELITFERIRTFIFVPKTFLSFQNISYNLKEDEIILLEDLLYGDYFEDIVPKEINPYTKDVVNWDTAEPSHTVPYVNTFNMTLNLKDNTVNQCIVTESQNKKLVLGRWKESGLQDYNILEFKQSHNCSWELLKDILKIHTGRENTIASLVKTLVDRYNEISQTGNYGNILGIIKTQGKKDQVASLLAGVPIADIITPSNYYLTTIDFFLLAQAYDIPLIILCRTKIPTVFSQYVSFISEDTPDCYIIMSGGFANADSIHSPNYGLITRNESIQLSIADLGDVFAKINGLNITSLDSFITRASQAKILAKRKKPKIKVKVAKQKGGPRRVKKLKTKVKLG